LISGTVGNRSTYRLSWSQPRKPASTIRRRIGAASSMGEHALKVAFDPVDSRFIAGEIEEGGA
jgi:hypothetical protein